MLRHSRRDDHALHADEFQLRKGSRTLLFQAQFDCLSNPLHQQVQRRCLGMTPRQRWNGSDVEPRLISFDHDVKGPIHDIYFIPTLRATFGAGAGPLCRQKSSTQPLYILVGAASGRTPSIAVRMLIWNPHWRCIMTDNITTNQSFYAL